MISGERMVEVKIDMTGWVMKEHGVPDSRLTVIRQIEDHVYPNGKHAAMWECICEDGNIVNALGGDIRSGHILSCGCLRKEVTSLKGKLYGAKNSEKAHEVLIKRNKYNLDGDCGICYLSDGTEVMFDKEDYDLIKDWTWYKDGHGYVVSHKAKNNVRTCVKMHMLVMGSDGSMDVDHIFGNKLDNRKSQLRFATRAENTRNQGLRKNNTSGCKGVSWHKNRKTWVAEIQGKYIGSSDSLEEAKLLYDNKAKELYGEFYREN